jgi:periplasmic protein TonB
VSSKSNHQQAVEPQPPSTSLQSCLVDGDATQQAHAHRLRRRSLLISVLAQIVVLTALILIPILSKTEHIALAKVMPMPPYHHAAGSSHTAQRTHPAVPTHRLSFCLECSPVRPSMSANTHGSPHDSGAITIGDSFPDTPECSDCANLIGRSNPQPLVPREPTPRMVYVTRLDPAMLIHRVEPIFPTLARQTAHEGAVELRAIVATDGSVRSLQFLAGDPRFYLSARHAVSQWRYKPTVLNGTPVEVDTHITVIYKLNR